MGVHQSRDLDEAPVFCRRERRIGQGHLGGRTYPACRAAAMALYLYTEARLRKGVGQRTRVVVASMPDLDHHYPPGPQDSLCNDAETQSVSTRRPGSGDQICAFSPGEDERVFEGFGAAPLGRL